MVVEVWCTVPLTAVPSRAREWLSPVTPVKVKAADVTCGTGQPVDRDQLGRHPLTADGRCPVTLLWALERKRPHRCRCGCC